MTASALSGITVLDLGQAFMGPYCGLLMQRLGADVIKIEPPQGEPYRRPTAIKGVEAVQFGLLNAGKRSLCIDLKSARGRQIFTDLAATADVIIQNFAPGAFDRLVGVEGLLAANPRLIVASGSGYGSTGPRREGRAMDLTIQALAGVMATTGFPESGPVRTGPAVVDFMGGAHLFGAVMAALVQRGTSGRGQHVEVALYDSIFPSLASNIGGYFDSDGQIPERTGNHHGGLAVAPYNAYQTADGWIAILCLHDRHWASLCQIMGRRELIDDQRLSTNASRVKHMDLLDRVVGEWTLDRTSAELETVLDEGAIPSASVQSLADVLKDPQIKARGMFEHHRNAEREWWTFGSPLRLTDSPPPAGNVPPRLGQHTVEILRDKLMLPLDQIRELRAAGAVIDDSSASIVAVPRASDPVL